jgi:hypothetical protein
MILLHLVENSRLWCCQHNVQKEPNNVHARHILFHTSFILPSYQKPSSHKNRNTNISYSNFVRKKPATFQLTFNEKLGKIILTITTIGRSSLDYKLWYHRMDGWIEVPLGG